MGVEITPVAAVVSSDSGGSGAGAAAWSSDAGRAVSAPLALVYVAGLTNGTDKEEAGEEEMVVLFSTGDVEDDTISTDGLI